MVKVAIKTYGCKVNQYESQLLRENLRESGYKVSRQDESDIILINSCCVTGKAESEAVRLVKKSLQAGKKVWLTGCGVKKDSELLKFPGVEIFKDKDLLVDSLLAGIKRITGFYEHTRAFVKIEDGCENFCSYCIVPYVRGPVRSRCEEDIVCEVENLAANGYKEIVLTGVDMGAYGSDKGTCLAELIDKISGIGGIKRLRLSSIEAFHLSDRLLDRLAGNSLVCPHFHIPLQSGSDRVLSLMRRRYAFDGYMEKIEKIRKKVEGVTFTTDIMVGFPGETAEDFNLSCRAIEIAGFIKVHIFRYSMRKETPAYYFAGHLPESVKKGREAELKYLAEETGSMVKKGFVDSFFDILAEKQCGEEWQGYSSNYIPAFFNSDKELANKIIRVKAKKVEGHKLFCVPV